MIVSIFNVIIDGLCQPFDHVLFCLVSAAIKEMELTERFAAIKVWGKEEICDTREIFIETRGESEVRQKICWSFLY